MTHQHGPENETMDTLTYRRVDLSEFEGHSESPWLLPSVDGLYLIKNTNGGICRMLDRGENAERIPADMRLIRAAPDMAAELAALREQVRLLREALGYIESEAWSRDTMVSGIRRRIVNRASAALSATAPKGGAT